jgi:hypothetical protein
VAFLLRCEWVEEMLVSATNQAAWQFDCGASATAAVWQIGHGQNLTLPEADCKRCGRSLKGSRQTEVPDVDGDIHEHTQCVNRAWSDSKMPATEDALRPQGASHGSAPAGFGLDPGCAPGGFAIVAGSWRGRYTMRDDASAFGTAEVRWRPIESASSGTMTAMTAMMMVSAGAT